MLRLKSWSFGKGFKAEVGGFLKTRPWNDDSRSMRRLSLWGFSVKDTGVQGHCRTQTEISSRRRGRVLRLYATSALASIFGFPIVWWGAAIAMVTRQRSTSTWAWGPPANTTSKPARRWCMIMALGGAPARRRLCPGAVREIPKTPGGCLRSYTTTLHNAAKWWCSMLKISRVLPRLVFCSPSGCLMDFTATGWLMGPDLSMSCDLLGDTATASSRHGKVLGPIGAFCAYAGLCEQQPREAARLIG